MNLIYGNANVMRPWQLGRGQPKSTTPTKRPGNTYSTRTTTTFTNTPQRDWPKSMRTRSTSKPGRAVAHKTKQRKKALIDQCKQPWQQGKHQWKPHRSGYQCHTCQTRVHQGLTAAMIEERLQEDCAQLTAPTLDPDLPPGRAVGKKPTRASRIASLLKLQQEHPITPDVHRLQETTGYLKCSKCNQAIHKRANEELFNQFLNSTCIDAPFNQAHQAHSPQHPHSLADWQVHSMQRLWTIRPP